MNTRKFFIGLFLIGAISGVLNACYEMRSPIDLYRYAPSFHYPFDPVDEKGWGIDIWKTFYHRSASEAFQNRCEPCCDPCCPNVPKYDKVTTQTTPIASLFFGKPCFKAEEAFCGGKLETPCNPFLSFARLKPQFDFSEDGGVIGLHMYRSFGESGHGRYGMRVGLPIVATEIKPNCCCGLEELEETLDDVVQRRHERATTQQEVPAEDQHVVAVQPTNAYRFDLLTSLQNKDGSPLVTCVGGKIMVCGIEIAPHQPGNNGQNNSLAAPVHVIKSSTGDLPKNIRFFRSGGGLDDSTLAPLPANGVAGNDRYFFSNTTDYCPLLNDTDTLATLFLVPSSVNDTSEPLLLGSEAIFIQNVVDDILSGLEETGNNSVRQWLLKECCIDICHGKRQVGLGNLDVQFYTGWHPDNWYADAHVGFKFPTDVKRNPREVLSMATGNNGHYEIRLGVEGGWKVNDWFAFHGGANYSHVFKEKCGCKAASFCGAKVGCLGPPVQAETSWDYFIAFADATFFHPKNQDLGFTLGYEFYGKREDNVCFCDNTAKDCCGNECQLDPCLCTVNSNVQTHKLRCEFFHRFYYWELFLGGSHVIAGRNALKESEAHVGVAIYF